MLLVYKRQVRSILETAVPAWHSSITKTESTKIEREQKKAFAVILGNEYRSYENALKTLKQEKLVIRREKLTLRFALKASKDPNHSKMFPILKDNDRNLRSKGSPQKTNEGPPPKNNKYMKTYKEFTCKTKRFFQSSIPYMTRMLNKYNDSKK